MMCGMHLFGLSNVLQTGLEPVVASVVAWQLSSFLCVMCCGDAFHGLGVHSVEDLILVGALFLPSVAPVCQRGFGVMEFRLCASVP
jgi:hypothetical protein